MKEIKQIVQEMISAHSCYQGLKDAGQAYLDSIGTDKENEMAKKLIEVTEDSVQSIDEVLEFFQSERGKQVFGEETSANLTKQAKEVKAKDGKYCFCPACTAGVELLKRKAEIL